MRTLHMNIAEHVDFLIVKHGETSFYKNEIVKLVKESMQSDGKFSDFEL